MTLDTIKPPLERGIWWGDIAIKPGATMLWEIGAMQFALQRLALEWRVACKRREAGEQSDGQMVDLAALPEDLEAVVERYICNQSLCILPALADRPVVSRPANPLTLFPGEEVRIYVSTPLWARIQTADKKLVLKEFSLLQLSDTWFGPSTLEGELCYATRTHARLALDAMPRHNYRATSTLLLKNQAETALVLERLNLPVTYLGLYQDSQGELWTDGIELIREEESDKASLKIKPGPPAGIAGAVRIAEPRKKTEGGLLVRAFGSLFS
ncbi:MAG: hypothetical protein OQL20_07840 [Sedimenticola sp.]|nr:hypothetical protein [Sedimenticola sp.]